MLITFQRTMKKSVILALSFIGLIVALLGLIRTSIHTNSANKAVQFETINLKQIELLAGPGMPRPTSTCVIQESDS